VTELKWEENGLAVKALIALAIVGALVLRRVLGG
jgi:hypothetical protein